VQQCTKHGLSLCTCTYVCITHTLHNATKQKQLSSPIRQLLSQYNASASATPLPALPSLLCSPPHKEQQVLNSGLLFLTPCTGPVTTQLALPHCEHACVSGMQLQVCHRDRHITNQQNTLDYNAAHGNTSAKHVRRDRSQAGSSSYSHQIDSHLLCWAAAHILPGSSAGRVPSAAWPLHYQAHN